MFFLKPLKKWILKRLRKNEDEIINFFNEKLDIPKMTEKQEQELYKKIFNIILDLVDTLI